MRNRRQKRNRRWECSTEERGKGRCEKMLRDKRNWDGKKRRTNGTVGRGGSQKGKKRP